MDACPHNCRRFGDFYNWDCYRISIDHSDLPHSWRKGSRSILEESLFGDAPIRSIVRRIACEFYCLHMPAARMPAASQDTVGIGRLIWLRVVSKYMCSPTIVI